MNIWMNILRVKRKSTIRVFFVAILAPVSVQLIRTSDWDQNSGVILVFGLSEKTQRKTNPKSEVTHCDAAVQQTFVVYSRCVLYLCLALTSCVVCWSDNLTYSQVSSPNLPSSPVTNHSVVGRRHSDELSHTNRHYSLNSPVSLSGSNYHRQTDITLLTMPQCHSVGQSMSNNYSATVLTGFVTPIYWAQIVNTYQMPYIGKLFTVY